MSTFLAEGSGANMPIQQWPFAIGQEDPVLVVDDQVVMGDLTRRLLARLGFENVEYTTDGYHALALFARQEAETRRFRSAHEQGR